MLGYVVITVFALVAALIFWATTTIRVRKICYNARKQVKIENVYLEALKLDIAVQNMDIATLSKFPTLHSYLRQSHALVEKGSGDFDKLVVARMSSDKTYFDRYFSELTNMPDGIAQLVNRQVSIIKDIAVIKHPIGTCMRDVALKTVLCMMVGFIEFISLFPSKQEACKRLPDYSYIKAEHMGKLLPQ